MKNTLSLTVALAALALTSSAFAGGSKKTELQAAAPATGLVPSKVVSPSDLPLSFTRQVVNIEFTLDAAGQPQDIKVKSRSHDAIAAREQIVKAFRQWKFEPNRQSAATTAQRFILPLEIVPQV